MKELIPFAVGAIFSAGVFYAATTIKQAQTAKDLKGLGDMNRRQAGKEEQRLVESVYSEMMGEDTAGRCQEIYRIRMLSRY